MLELTQLYGFNSTSGAAAAITLTYINTLSTATNGTTINLGDIDVPTAGLLIAAVSGFTSGGTTTINSVSLGGTNGTLHANNSGSSCPTCIATRQVSSGNNNVTIVFSALALNVACDLYVLTGNISDTPTDTESFDTTGTTSRVNTLDLPANSVAVYTVIHADASNTVWSSATERSDIVLDAVFQHSSASKTTVSELPGNTETSSWTGSVGNGSSAACWN